MSTKITGLEWKAYQSSDDPAFWPDGAYMDDVLISVDGQDWDEDQDYALIADSAKVTIVCGSYCRPERESTSLEAHFKRWRKAQTHEVLVFNVPKALTGAVKGAVQQLLSAQQERGNG